MTLTGMCIFTLNISYRSVCSRLPYRQAMQGTKGAQSIPEAVVIKQAMTVGVWGHGMGHKDRAGALCVSRL